MRSNSFSDVCFSILKYMFFIMMVIIVVTCIFFSNIHYNCSTSDRLFFNGQYPLLFLTIGLAIGGGNYVLF